MRNRFAEPILDCLTVDSNLLAIKRLGLLSAAERLAAARGSDEKPSAGIVVVWVDRRAVMREPMRVQRKRIL